MYKVALMVAVLAACGGGSKPAQSPEPPPQETISNTQPATTPPAPAPQTPVAEAMAKMREFRDRMCACKDETCAKAVADDMTKWAQEMAQKPQEPMEMSEADQKAATEIGTRMGECMQSAMGMGSGSATP